MKLRMARSRINYWAMRYKVPVAELNIISYRDAVKDAGYLTKQQLRELVHWKSPRNIGRVESSSDEFIMEITSFALTSTDERARIESLTLLDGVGWPTASVILHLYHPNAYPILDFRALWAVNTEVPSQYTFAFWQSYTKFCARLASEAGISMRVLDRALWQHSSEEQDVA